MGKRLNELKYFQEQQSIPLNGKITLTNGHEMSISYNQEENILVLKLDFMNQPLKIYGQNIEKFKQLISGA